VQRVDGAQNEGVEQAEHHGIGADSEPATSSQSEAGTAQHAQAEARSWATVSSMFPGSPALYLVPFVPAEFDARTPFRFLAPKAGAFEVVGAVLDVGEEFVVHFAVDPGSAEGRGNGSPC
jgi:hypothetical protein